MHFLSGAMALAMFTLIGPGAAAAALPQDTVNAGAGWTVDQPLTGRAIPCEQAKAQFEIVRCRNVELLSFLPKHAIGQSSGADLWGWSDSATGREFIAIGANVGGATAFVEVTDPVNPKHLGVLLPHKAPERHAAQSVKIYKNHAFIGYEGTLNGIQIFDLIQLRDVKDPPVEFQQVAHYDGVANAHTITVNQETGFATINGSNTCGGGLHMLDLRMPTTPRFLGCYTETQASASLNAPGYVHDAQCVVYRGPDQQYQGREICVNAVGGGVTVADVTDRQQPKTISIFSYPNVGYAHQGWFTEDQRYFFLDDELDEMGGAKALLSGQLPAKPNRMRTMVFDMNDLDDPVVLTEYTFPFAATDHNLYIHGRYMYQGNNDAGLRILDVADPKHPREVGFLMIGRGRAWGTYPFLKNDVVAVSTDLGLVLARLQPQ